jgi:hypothetical protein
MKLYPDFGSMGCYNPTPTVKIAIKDRTVTTAQWCDSEAWFSRISTGPGRNMALPPDPIV